MSEPKSHVPSDGIPEFLRRTDPEKPASPPPVPDSEWNAASPMASNVTDITKTPRRTRATQQDPAKDAAKEKAEQVFAPKQASPAPDTTKAPRVLPSIGNPLLFKFFSDLAAEEKKKDAAVSNIRKIRKQAKADGIDLAAADLVRKEMKLSPDELIETNNRINEYRAQMRLPAYQPLELEGATVRTPEEQLQYIELEGERAGLRGASQSDNPHDVDTEAGARWLTGYDRGQEQLRQVFRNTLTRNNKAKQDKEAKAAPAPAEAAE